MNKEEAKEAISTLYDHTKDFSDKQQESINRLNGRSSALIGFAGLLIKVSSDLSEEHSIVIYISCICAIFSIILSATGLRAKKTSTLISPDFWMQKPYIYEDDVKRKTRLTRDKINLINSDDELIRKKQNRINLTIMIFILGIIFYALGVTNLDTQITSFILENSTNNYFNRPLYII